MRVEKRASNDWQAWTLTFLAWASTHTLFLFWEQTKSDVIRDFSFSLQSLYIGYIYGYVIQLIYDKFIGGFKAQPDEKKE